MTAGIRLPEGQADGHDVFVEADLGLEGGHGGVVVGPRVPELGVGQEGPDPHLQSTVLHSQVAGAEPGPQAWGKEIGALVRTLSTPDGTFRTPKKSDINAW